MLSGEDSRLYDLIVFSYFLPKSSLLLNKELKSKLKKYDLKLKNIDYFLAPTTDEIDALIAYHTY